MSYYRLNVAISFFVQSTLSRNTAARHGILCKHAIIAPEDLYGEGYLEFIQMQVWKSWKVFSKIHCLKPNLAPSPKYNAFNMWKIIIKQANISKKSWFWIVEEINRMPHLYCSMAFIYLWLNLHFGTRNIQLITIRKNLEVKKKNILSFNSWTTSATCLIKSLMNTKIKLFYIKISDYNEFSASMKYDL